MSENHSTPTEPEWTVVQQAAADDGLHLLRLLDVGANFPFRNYPERFSVLWEFAELDAEGLPSAAELTRMKDFENALCAVMQADHAALLVMVFTEPAHREFILLARNKSAFQNRLNSAEGLGEKLPISLDHETDAQGEFYLSYATKVLKRYG
ncbi:DUF695 domain-containing protein [Thiothrix litoralis]|uniref:DUF695 domain-containing protein n=2 Tax=Thiothrix TaxID=1030 RepID=A0ABY9MUK2_9GAMM|nr:MULTISPECIES: DUF695 domain-containing protein [Thiothrix]QTR45931.1 DUF695 domain-containing protein [Thiothrix litoralis]WML92122.1 DUF695 domain-containing protein [Thiothrix lacustris]